MDEYTFCTKCFDGGKVGTTGRLTTWVLLLSLKKLIDEAFDFSGVLFYGHGFSFGYS